jgi:hypothetical protein
MSRSIYVNLGAQLITCTPDWSAGIKTTFSTKTSIVETLSGCEHRVAKYERPLVSMSFKATNMDSYKSGYIKELLTNRGNHPVGMPVWMDATYVTESVSTGDSYIVCDARNKLFPWFRYAILWSSPFVYDVVIPSSIEQATLDAGGSNERTVWVVRLNTGDVLGTGQSFTVTQQHSSGAFLVPLAFGKMTIPELKFYSGKVSKLEIDFDEKFGVVWHRDVPGATVLGAPGTLLLEDYLRGGVTQTGAAASAPATFPITPNWTTKPTEGETDDIDYDELSVGVPIPQTGFQAQRAKLKFGYTTNRHDLQKVLMHFEGNDGCRGSFYISRGSVSYASGSFVSSGTITARYSDDEITVTCLHPDAFEFQITFVQCNMGASIDSTNKIAYLYRFKKGTEDTDHWMQCTKLFCDYGFALKANFYIGDALQEASTANDTTFFQATDITHGTVTHTEEMMGEEIEIEVSGVARNYIMSEHRSPTEVEIYKISRNDFLYAKSNGIETITYPDATSIFCGIIVSKRIESSGEVTIKASSNLRVMERMLSHFKIQRQCNHVLYSTPCALNKEDYVAFGEVLARDVGDVTPELVEGWVATKTIKVKLTIDERCFDWPDIEYSYVGDSTVFTENYFEGATILFDDGQRYIVTAAVSALIPQATLTEKSVILHLQGFPVVTPTTTNGTTTYNKIQLYPWCNHTIQHCKYKFGWALAENMESNTSTVIRGNTANFGGCPWLPANNTIENLSVDEDDGKK